MSGLKVPDAAPASDEAEEQRRRDVVEHFEHAIRLRRVGEWNKFHEYIKDWVRNKIGRDTLKRMALENVNNRGEDDHETKKLQEEVEEVMWAV